MSGTPEGAAGVAVRRSVEDDRRLAAGLERQRQGDATAARRLYLEVLARHPDDAEVLHLLGLAARQAGRHGAAIAFLARAAAVTPDDAMLLNNLGAVLREAGRQDEALEACRKAAALAPDLTWAHINMGVVHRDCGRLPEALAAFDHALAIVPDHPDAQWERALAKLLGGDLRGGFADYEARTRRANRRIATVPEPRWRGEDVAGRRILLHAEQGAGDSIQFARYVPLLAARGATVHLQVQPGLVRLLRRIAGATSVCDVRSAPPEVDFHASLLSLPLLMRTGETPIPASVPYLPTPDGGVALPGRDGKRVGLAWAGNPRHRNDRNRSLHLSTLLPLLEVPGITFVSLQTGQARTQIAETHAEGLLHDATEGLRDFADTAAVVARLDLVISVDTALAHLAGALARPVLLLVPHAPDWRWGLGSEESPWYPTMRLLRQSEPGDWSVPVAACIETLAAAGIGDVARM